MNLSLTQLRHLIALAESGSFTRGADRTRRSQAAFSRSISVLESGLGVTLVERAGHRNTLTPIGRTVLEHARLMVAQADELQQVVRHHLGADAGQVRLGLAPTPAALLSGPLLRYAAGYPGGMTMRLSRGPIDQQLLALRTRQLDGAVIDQASIPLADSDLLVEPIAQLPTGVLCRPGHPLRNLPAPQLADLVRYPVAGTGASDAVARQLVQRFGPQAHPDSLIALGTEDVTELLQLACDSDAVYVGILAPARPWLNSGALVPLPVTTDAPPARLAWVQRTARAPNPVLDGVRAQVQAQLASLDESPAG